MKGINKATTGRCSVDLFNFFFWSRLIEENQFYQLYSKSNIPEKKLYFWIAMKLMNEGLIGYDPFLGKSKNLCSTVPFTILL